MHGGNLKLIEKLHDLYDSSNIISVMKSRREWRAGHLPLVIVLNMS